MYCFYTEYYNTARDKMQNKCSVVEKIIFQTGKNENGIDNRTYVLYNQKQTDVRKKKGGMTYDDSNDYQRFSVRNVYCQAQKGWLEAFFSVPEFHQPRAH